METTWPLDHTITESVFMMSTPGIKRSECAKVIAPTSIALIGVLTLSP